MHVNTRQQFKTILSDYYRRWFPVERIKELFGNNIMNREFGFRYQDGTFIRGIFFRDVNELQYFLSSTIPLHVYVGALHNNDPFIRRQSITKLQWKGREFTLDIDINFQQWRHCGCQGSQICMDCIKFLIIGVQFYDNILHDHFGFNNVQWFFSGRRGVHCWIFDKNAIHLDKMTRAAIIDYMSLQEQSFKKLNVQLQRTILTTLVPCFFKLASLEELEQIGFPKHLLKQKLDMLKIGNGKWKKINRSDITLEALNRLTCMALIPTDRNVTVDVTHLVRLPYSINGESGRIVLPIRDFNDIDEWINYFFSINSTAHSMFKEIKTFTWEK